MIIYGSMQCPDCTACVNRLKGAGIAFEFREILGELAAFKEFLALRDKSPVFDVPKEKGGIGIPCLVQDDGTVTLDWEKALGL